MILIKKKQPDQIQNWTYSEIIYTHSIFHW